MRRPAASRTPAAPKQVTKQPPNRGVEKPPGTAVPASAPARAAPAPARQGIRPTSASRLTIKRGSQQSPHAQLLASTRSRPGGVRRLSEVDLDEDEVLLEGFDATLQGQRVRITAVLERTCVYQDASGDRKLARKEDLWIEADQLPIRRRGPG
ncbi:MAG TPA: hypothetical protein VGG31_07065 [Candidatus Dormibacteraeota bacterium]